MTYIALHHHPDVPIEKRVPGYEGLWIDAERLGDSQVVIHLPRGAFALPTGRTELREYDGAVAEVWEVQVIDTARSDCFSVEAL